MLHFARFALFIGLSAAAPVVFALNPPKQQDQNKQPPRAENEKKKAEPAKKDSPAAEDRLDRRNARMKERNREIDGLLNKQKQ
jgi:hypothetical protein